MMYWFNSRFDGARLFFGVALLLALIAGAISCGTKKESRNEMPSRDINAVMTDHTTELMAIPGVTGTAIGELDDHTPCILVLVEKETDEIKKAVPKKLEGHPVQLLVTGKIVPMGTE
jgi:hypothetical protein